MPEIFASCDLYCCTSWYEGFGLPALEAFRCGVPVVSTRTFGVSDYGVDGENIVLARPADPQDLYDKIRDVLNDVSLADSLRERAFKTVETDYDWATSVSIFRDLLERIFRTYTGAGPIDQREMDQILTDLEREGNLTPMPVFKRFQELSGELNEVFERLLKRRGLTASDVGPLSNLRDELRRFLVNEQAEYYDAFKAKFDLCQLVLSLQDNARASEYLKLILTPKDKDESRTASSFSEIRY